jgi:hypothetical protein
MKPPLRTKSIGTKVSEEEFAALEARARAVGLTLSEWVRDVLLSAPAMTCPDSGEVALAEVLALRSLFLNLQFRAASQSPVTEANVRGLIERADGVKMQRARESLAEERATTKPISLSPTLIRAPEFQVACPIGPRLHLGVRFFSGASPRPTGRLPSPVATTWIILTILHHPSPKCNTRPPRATHATEQGQPMANICATDSFHRVELFRSYR